MQKMMSYGWAVMEKGVSSKEEERKKKREFSPWLVPKLLGIAFIDESVPTEINETKRELNMYQRVRCYLNN